MNCLSTEKRTQVVSALIEGNSVRATVRMTGVCKDTVLKLLVDLGTACASYHNSHVRNVHPRHVQCDEIWNFCYAKAKNAPDDKKALGAGDVWTWIAIDADSKLGISYLVGKRDAADAHRLMQDLSSRVANRFQLTTDGHHVYLNAVEDTFGSEIDYAMLVKVYGAASETETRYSPGRITSTQLSVIAGTPEPRHISTSYVERQNLTIRMSMRRFTRLTNAFSKKLDNLKHSVALHFMYYNFFAGFIRRCA
jgi:IS1 family transposase